MGIDRIKIDGFFHKNEGYGLYPPFNLANLTIDWTKEQFTVPFDALYFYLAKL